MSILKRKRLYKDTNGQVWHIKSDGKAVKYPQCEEFQEVPLGTYEEILYSKYKGVEVHDKLHLADGYDGCFHIFKLCLITPDSEKLGRTTSVFDVIMGKWEIRKTQSYDLLPAVDLKKGKKYMVKEKPVTFEYYDKEKYGFRFSLIKSEETENSVLVPGYQMHNVKEIVSMPKEYKVWETENGEFYGRDCETERTFVINKDTFERVEYFAKQPKVGDIVYINNLTGVKPYEVTFVQNIAKRLNDDLLMLRYAYGYYPNFDTRDQNKRLWKVLYVGTAHSLIEEHSTGTRSMICVCDNDSLTVFENQEDDEPF